MDQLELVIISAIFNGIITAIAIYIGFRKGTEKTVDIVLDRLQKRLNKSSAAQKLIKAIETSDKLFGDDQLITQATNFFKEAANLVSSQETKNFIKSLTALMTAKPPEIKKIRKVKIKSKSDKNN
jgi:hypothetical protein